VDHSQNYMHTWAKSYHNEHERKAILFKNTVEYTGPSFESHVNKYHSFIHSFKNL